MDINEKSIKLLSTIGSRASFGMGTLDLVKKNKDLMVVTCDVSTSAGLDRFRKTFPDNYIDLGIAEQNMIGVATGLANEKFKVITTTFAPFQTLRCCEQIKVNLGYMKEKITMVGLASGLVLGNLGFTHCCIEDVGVLRSIPNITIISPSDSLETIKAVEASIDHNQTCYIRLTGGSNNPIVNKKDYKFEIGKVIKLLDGDDITIFASGASVAESMTACEELKKSNLNINLINVHTIKPLDEENLTYFINKSKLIVTVEEHNVIGGLGSAVAELICKIGKTTKLVSLGINNTYCKSGSYNHLKDIYGLSSQKIIEAVSKNL